MGIVIRQSIKASIVSYFGIVIGAVTMLIIFPAFLEPNEIGLIQSIRAIAFILLPLASVGLPALTYRFFPFYQDPAQKHHGFLSFLLLTFFGGFIITAVLFMVFKDVLLNLYQDNAPLLMQYYWYILPLTFYSSLFGILSAYSGSVMRIVVPNLLNDVVYKILALLLVLAFAFHFLPFDSFLLLFFNVNAIPLVLLVLYIWWLKHLYLKVNWNLFSRSTLKELGPYSLFNVAFNASTYLILYMDIIMLGILLGEWETGIYTIAFFIGSVIEVPKRSISLIATPLIGQAFKKDNLKEIENLYKKTSINQMLAGLLLFLNIWLSIDPLFNLIPNGDIYSAGKWVVFFIGLSKIIDMMMGCNIEIIAVSKYYRFNLVSTIILAALMISTNLLFIPKFGIAGAAGASALAILLFNIVNFTFLALTYKIQPFTFATIKALAAATITYGLVYILPDVANPFLQIIINSIAISAVFGGLALWWRISDDANKVVVQIWRKF